MAASTRDPIRFDGQVAIITGAGGGMGESYAREMARRGARVVVNDYGGDMFGAGGAPGPAEKVAASIRAEGGEAVADCTPVGTAEAAHAIAAAALENFGRIDILINNAGISAAGAINAPSDERAERTFRTNLLGPYFLIRAVWPTMAAQRYGRILNIASSAALGMGWSAPYSASKAGLIGLALDAAQEGAAEGILVNALLPTAYSRMIEAVPDRLFVDWMREQMPADKVAAAALFLVSANSIATGCVFSAGGGRVARLAWFEAAGMFAAEATPECVRDSIAEASDMKGATLIANQRAEIDLYMRRFPMADGRVASLPSKR